MKLIENNIGCKLKLKNKIKIKNMWNDVKEKINREYY